jgi:ferrous iron transport protein B
MVAFAQDGSAKQAPSRTPVIALAGNPNCGKTTVFNALTGMRQKVANYPGVTVDKKTGRAALGDGVVVDILDLPGTYSLIPFTPDEMVTAEVLRGMRADTRAPDVILAIVDASNLARNLYLVSQLMEMNRPMVVALNMSDIAERRGLIVDEKLLGEKLGLPVVKLIGHKRGGIDRLRVELREACGKHSPRIPAWELGPAYTAAIRELTGLLGPDQGVIGGQAHRLLLEDPGADLIQARVVVGPLLEQCRKHLLELGVDPLADDISARYRWIDGIVNAAVTRKATSTQATWSDRADAVLLHPVWGFLTFAIVMAVVFSGVFWVAQPLMDGTSNLISHLGDVVAHLLPAGILKDLWTDGIVGGVGTVVTFIPQIAILFLFLAVLEDSGYLARAAFLMDKLLSRVGLHGKSFIPLLSSFACAIPGILATRTIEGRRDRLTTIMVAPFMSCSARLPVYFLLIGTFFTPFAGPNPFLRSLMLGGVMFACYALGVAAAFASAWIAQRIARRRGQQSAFILELPSYKIPQAGEVLRQMWTNASKFLTKAGTTIFALSVILWALARFPSLPDDAASRVRDQAHAAHPDWQTVAAAAAAADAAPEQAADAKPAAAPAPATAAPGTGQSAKIAAADTAIDAEQAAKSSTAGATTPETAAATPAAEVEDPIGDNAVAQAQMNQSFAGRLGHAIEPALAPIGADWKMGIGLIGAFAAREVFVSTLGIVYGVGKGEDGQTQNLSEALLADKRPDGRPVWTPLVATSMLVWFVLALQCISTVAVVRRETGGWMWPMAMLVGMNALAWVVCTAIYQIGSRL